MADEKVYKEVYQDMKKQGHCQRTSYSRYRERIQERNSAQKRKEFNDRKIRMGGSR